MILTIKGKLVEAVFKWLVILVKNKWKPQSNKETV